jgi:hypothetical protein
MRTLTAFVCTAIMLMAASALADPAQAQTPPASAAQTAPAPAATATPGAPAPAVTGATAAPAASTTADADLDQVVCKDAPAKTGSRIGGGRECHTQREWTRMQHESEELTRHQERNGYTSRQK